jgi:hypothetical protein
MNKINRIYLIESKLGHYDDSTHIIVIAKNIKNAILIAQMERPDCSFVSHDTDYIEEYLRENIKKISIIGYSPLKEQSVIEHIAYG